LSSENSKQPGFQRIVVKAGTNLLTGGGDHLDLTIMAALVDQVAQLRQAGHELLLVTSGAIAAGRQSLQQPREKGTGPLRLFQARRGVPFRQVLAAVGQSHLMHAYQELFARHGLVVAQALLTRHDIAERQGYLHVRDSLLTLLNLAVVPIINENDVVAVEEIGDEVFGDNDTLSALVSNLVDADLLVILTDTEGLYTADPAVDPKAKIIPRVEQVDEAVMELVATEQLHPMSRGGMATKLEAARLATSWGATVVIASGTTPDVLRDVVAGQPQGTIFLPRVSRMESRRRWCLSGLSTKGEILVDKGAVSALRSDHRSLLPAGVQEVRGDFDRHDVVLIIDGEGRRVACGVANYSSAEAAVIKGLHSDRIQEVLGHHYGDEVVHRNNLAVL
jgi:glutamate 5-kinase